MRIPRIYTPQALTANSIITLEEQASHHLIKVLRLSTNHPITLFNGKGGCYSAHIETPHKKAAAIRVLEFTDSNLDSPLATHIAIGLSKGDKLELIIQKATELGVHSISPITSQHSDVKMNQERADKKLRQWQHIAISACEQSGRNTVPTIHPVQSYAQWVSNINPSDTVALFHTRGGKKLSELEQPNNLHLCFGPEGGFSEAEVAALTSKHHQVLTLGRRILRAETAPIACLGAVQVMWGDW